MKKILLTIVVLLGLTSELSAAENRTYEVDGLYLGMPGAEYSEHVKEIDISHKKTDSDTNRKFGYAPKGIFYMYIANVYENKANVLSFFTEGDEKLYGIRTVWFNLPRDEGIRFAATRTALMGKKYGQGIDLPDAALPSGAINGTRWAPNDHAVVSIYISKVTNGVISCWVDAVDIELEKQVGSNR